MLSFVSFGQFTLDAGKEFRNSGNIYQGDEIIGRFVYSWIESVTDTVGRYEIKLYDDLFNEMAVLDFQHRGNMLTKVIVNEGKFVLFFESDVDWVIATVGADKVIQKEVILKSSLEKRKLNTISMSYYMGEYQGESYFEAHGDSMFLVLTNDWGFKPAEQPYYQAFQLTGYDTKLKKMWSFSDPNDKRTVAKIIGKSDKYIALLTTIFENFRETDGNLRYKLYIIDLSNGAVMCRETLMGFDEQSLLMTKAIFDENNQNVLLCGQYFKEGTKTIVKPSEGIAILDLNFVTKEKIERHILWEDLVAGVKSENLYGLSQAPKEMGRIKFLHDAFRFDNDHLGCIFESMSDLSAMGSTTVFYVDLDLTNLTSKSYVIDGKQGAASAAPEYIRMGYFLIEAAHRRSTLAVRMFRSNNETGQKHVICRMPNVTIGSVFGALSSESKIAEDELTVLKVGADSFELRKIPMSSNHDFFEISEGSGDNITIFEYDLIGTTSVLKNVRFELLKL